MVKDDLSLKYLPRKLQGYFNIITLELYGNISWFETKLGVNLVRLGSQAAE